MPDSFGLSFAPLASNAVATGSGPSAGASVNPIQEAIRVLSLRIPKVVGSSPIATAPLLNAAGGSGISQTAGTLQQPGFDLDEILRRLYGLSQQTAPSQRPRAPEAGGYQSWLASEPPGQRYEPGPMSSSIPAPNITPGAFPSAPVRLPEPPPMAPLPSGGLPMPSGGAPYDPFADQFEPNGYYGGR